MASIKRGALVASTLLLIAIIISACNQPYSQQPSVTNTPINPTSLFAPTLGQTPSMSDVEVFGTGTALALTGTPVGGVPTQTLAAGSTQPAVFVTDTPTPLITINTSTATLAVGNGVTTTPLVSGVYVLHKEEFPFCIARRNGVDPYDLLRASGLTSPDIYYEGMKIRIPQNSVWNEATLGPRALRTDHSYTVTGNGDTTVYGVACKYGVLDPGAIAQANNISADARLSAGQTLTIP
ncbi:MAG TPA: LysM peptidoglycan-binding domain-containing protein [Anaerolineales bacterium]|nr:LysM peptidoglycan-binding domain-containing protein [Anaerolineales bacterium]